MPKDKEARLAVGLGCELTIQIKGIEERIKAILVGMDPANYLIVRLELASKYKQKINKGTIFTVRYIFMGNVYGFQSLSLGSTTTPIKATYLSYPKTIESFNLRKTQRVNCYIPATATFHDKEIRGVVTDISIDGIRLTIIDWHVVLRIVAVNDSVTLSFPLLGIEGKQRFQGKIKSIISDTRKQSYGIQFKNLDTKLADAINAYVNDVLDYQGR